MDWFTPEFRDKYEKEQYYQRFPHRVMQGLVTGVMCMGMLLFALLLPVIIGMFFIDDEEWLMSWYWVALKWLAVPAFIGGFIMGWFITVSKYNKAADLNKPKC